MSDTIKKQRDSFLAFSFASADLLLEISQEGRVVFALGAARGITGVKEEDLQGKNWLELFSVYEQTIIQAAMDNARPGRRAGPFAMTLSPAMGGRKAIVTGIRMPGDPHYYLTIGFTSAVMEELASQSEAAPAPQDMLDRDGFIQVAQRHLRAMKELESAAYVTLLDLGPCFKAMEQLPEDERESARDRIETLILDHAAEGNVAGRFGEAACAFVHNKAVDPQQVRDALNTMIEEAMPEQEGAITICRTLQSDLLSPEKKDTVWALAEALDDFERSAADFALKTLQEALNQHKKTRPRRIEALKSAIERVSFSFVFQPIVDLETFKEDHFEIRGRLEDGGPMREWLALAEEENLLTQFDLAMTERVINHIKFKEGGTTRRFSMNITGASFADDTFCEQFLAEFTKNSDIAARLVFEVSNAGDVFDKAKLQKIFTALKRLGFRVALDEVKTDPEFLHKLRNLDVDILKLSATCTRALLTAPQTRRHYDECLADAKKKGRHVFAKGIEKEEHITVLKELGVRFGQGYFFGPLLTKPVFNPPKD